MNVGIITRKPWRNLAVLFAITAAVAVACQIPTSEEPEARSNPRLSIVGAPDRAVDFELVISGAGMETVRQQISTSDLDTELGPFEVPSRTDISFSLTAVDDIYSGRTSRRFGPGDEGNVEIAVYPGPVFVDQATGTVYQVRDLGVDITDPESGRWRSFTAAQIDIDGGAAGDIVDAEYDKEGYLWVLTDAGDLFAFDTLGDSPEPVASGVAAAGQAVTTSDYYVHVLTGDATIEYRERTLEHGVAYETLFGGDGPFFDDTVEGPTEELIEQFGGDLGFDDPVDRIHDIAGGGNGTLYILYSTGNVNYSGRLETDFDDLLIDAIRGAFTRDKVAAAIQRVRPADLGEELQQQLEVFSLVDFERLIQIIETLADLDLDFDYDEEARLEQEIEDTLESYLEDLVDFYVSLFEALAEITGEEFDEQEIDLEELAELFAFFTIFAVIEAEPEEIDEVVDVIRMWQALAAADPSEQQVADTFLEESGILDVDLRPDQEQIEHIRDNILDGIGLFRQDPFLAVVGVDPVGGAIVEGPVILGPVDTFADPVPAGTLYSAVGTGNLYAGQVSVEAAILGDLTDYRDDAQDGYPVPNGEQFGEIPGVIEYLQDQLDEEDALDDFFDTRSILEDVIAELVADALADLPERAPDRIGFLHTSGILRLRSDLARRGAFGAVDPDAGPQRGVFRGPRRFATARDGQLMVVDQSTADNGRLIRFSFGSTSGWRTLDEPQFYDGE